MRDGPSKSRVELLITEALAVLHALRDGEPVDEEQRRRGLTLALEALYDMDGQRIELCIGCKKPKRRRVLLRSRAPGYCQRCAGGGR